MISGITVTFNEVGCHRDPPVPLQPGAVEAVLNYTGGTGTTTLTFSNYTVLAGDTTSDLDATGLALNGGTIKDVYKNPAILTLSGTTLAANKAIVIDTTAPDTFILTKPALLSNNSSAAFTFNASESATFSCQVDGGGYGTCASPYPLADGPHTFSVYATDLAGNMDGTPASTPGPSTRPPQPSHPSRWLKYPHSSRDSSLHGDLLRRRHGRGPG